MTVLKNRKLTIGIILFILALILLFRLIGGKRQVFAETAAEDKIEMGISFIQQKEELEPKTVDETIRQLRAQNPQDVYEDEMARIEKNQNVVWSMFQDYVLMGDSRAVGFTYYDLLPESNVWAESGATIRDMETMIPQLLELSPENIFLCYGTNDFCSGFWGSPENYIAEYETEITKIQESLPSARIYVCSILPASQAAYDRGDLWDAIPEYNDGLSQMCERLPGCTFIDCLAVSEKYMDAYWQEDGIHFDEGFYPYWASQLVEGMLKSAIPADPQNPPIPDAGNPEQGTSSLEV